MAYAIVINLDYQHHHQEECARVWDLIKERMLDAGFRRDGRTFTINRPEEQATSFARRTIDEVDALLERPIYNFMNDFYGYDLACTTNLMTPAAEGIEVSLEENTKDRFFPS